MKNALLTILVIFWRVIILLPLRIQNLISILLGYFILYMPIRRNKISKINIDLCFKDLDENERYLIYKKNIISSAKVIFDTGVAWFWSNRRINKNIPYKINGLSKLLENQNSNNGVILFFKHSLHLELDSRILAMHADIYGIEREHNSDKFQKIQKSGRLKSLKGVTDRNNTITFIKWLKKGRTVLYAPDQDYGMKKSIEVNFFGNPAATISAPLKIIKITNCKTFFVNSFIEKGELILEIMEVNLDHSSIRKFSEELNKIFEDKIKNHPYEYLWQHRRFKSTLGKENIYK